MAEDEGYLAHMERVRKKFDTEVTAKARRPMDENKENIAYFSMEFGIHESLPLFAGGLGVLAGDHLKAAADLGVPIVGVGLFTARAIFINSSITKARSRKSIRTRIFFICRYPWPGMPPVRRLRYL